MVADGLDLAQIAALDAEAKAMDRDETQERAGTGQPCRALVVAAHSDDTREKPGRRVSGGRPMAVFLAQLMADADPALRPARLERTRNAAALYARTAGTPADKRRA